MFSWSRALRGNPEKEKNRFKMRENQSTTMVISWIRCFGKERILQPRTQACSRYPNDQRRLGTERDRRTWQVTSHPKSPRTTGNEAEKWRNRCRTQNQTWYLLFYHTGNTLINVIKKDWSKLPCYAYSLLIFTPKCPLFIATMLMGWGLTAISRHGQRLDESNGHEIQSPSWSL